MNKKPYAAVGLTLSALLALSACTEKTDTGDDASGDAGAPLGPPLLPVTGGSAADGETPDTGATKQ